MIDLTFEFQARHSEEKKACSILYCEMPIQILDNCNKIEPEQAATNYLNSKEKQQDIF